MLLVAVLLGVGGGVALGVVGGRTVPITAAPWTVVVWEKSPYAGLPPYPACTGVIIGPRSVVTAGHCVMAGDSARPLPPAAFHIEAGASNFERPLPTDHRESRTVSAVLVMPGYIAASKLSPGTATRMAGHDLAVLRLSRPLDLRGKDVRAASLPTARTPKPSGASKLLIAGFGLEKPKGTYPNGTLNEVVKSRVLRGCTTTQVLCVYSATNTCSGDSGAGAVEPGRVPTVVGISSLDLNAVVLARITLPSSPHRRSCDSSSPARGHGTTAHTARASAYTAGAGLPRLRGKPAVVFVQGERVLLATSTSQRSLRNRSAERTRSRPVRQRGAVASPIARGEPGNADGIQWRGSAARNPAPQSARRRRLHSAGALSPLHHGAGLRSQASCAEGTDRR